MVTIAAILTYLDAIYMPKQRIPVPDNDIPIEIEPGLRPPFFHGIEKDLSRNASKTPAKAMGIIYTKFL
jgi:hypothetical protein